MPASKNGEAAISAIRKTTRRRFLQLAGSAAALPAISRFARAQTPQYFSITPGQEFTSNAWCYQRLAPNAPIDPNSANIVQYLRTAVQPSSVLYNNLAMPIWIIQPGVPTVSVNADGTVVVGQAIDASDQPQAFRWTRATRMQSVLTLLLAAKVVTMAGFGWRLESANAVSADGTVIVGDGVDPLGLREGWIARLPEDNEDCNEDENEEQLEGRGQRD